MFESYQGFRLDGLKRALYTYTNGQWCQRAGIRCL